MRDLIRTQIHVLLSDSVTWFLSMEAVNAGDQVHTVRCTFMCLY